MCGLLPLVSAVGRRVAGFFRCDADALGQALRCLHPPAGALALLGVMVRASVGFVVMPVLIGSLSLTAMAVVFSRPKGHAKPYLHHWL